MFLIYVLTNVKTGERYVGQTSQSIESRFTKHVHSSISTRFQHIKLYKAINEYGLENFDYDIICFTDTPDDDERYWIAKLDTYHHGYNSNSGGGGGRYGADCPRRTKINEFTDQDIINLYDTNRNINSVIKKTGLSYKVIRRVLKKNNINVKSSGNVTRKEVSYSLAIVDEYDNNINIFKTQFLACEFVKQNKKVSSKDSNIIHNIKKCLDGKRSSAYGYKWKYIDINDHIDDMV